MFAGLELLRNCFGEFVSGCLPIGDVIEQSIECASGQLERKEIGSVSHKKRRRGKHQFGAGAGQPRKMKVASRVDIRVNRQPIFLAPSCALPYISLKIRNHYALLDCVGKFCFGVKNKFKHR